tara:strand:- start:1265 stop:1909 length:645 start_codon:yes stop_codon:yes gene_type:complete
MFTEIACYSQDSTFEDLMRTIFISSQSGAKFVALPSGFLNRVQDFIEHQEFSAVVDFPYGISTTQVRLHEIILSIRSGARAIDLVLHSGYLKEGNWKKVSEDLKACNAVCKENEVSLRPIIEYRLFEPKTILTACEILEKNGIYTLINSTCSIIDDPNDNAIICHSIQKNTSLSVISCSNRITDKYYKIFEDIGIEAFRFTSPVIAENILSSGV